MSKLFINYRRDDSADYAGRLYDRLAGHFGHDYVFMDIDQIKLGEVFDQVIQDKLKAVQVAVVLIGKHWLDIADANGQRRLDDSDDWVRLEIAALLERGIRVIPVLVGGAAMPKSPQLPECLTSLTRRQASEITNHARFHADTDKLIKALEEVMGVPSPKQPEPPGIPKKPGFSRFVAIAGVIGIGFVGIYFGLMPSKQAQMRLEPENPIIGPIAATVSTETIPITTNKLTTEQPQAATAKPMTQPVTELPKAGIIEPKMVHIPSGKFLMGSNDGRSNERPVHEVMISYAFEIGKYEVTFDEYDAFAKDTQRKLPDDRGWGRGRRPVINVTFDDAQAYATWLSKKTGKRYRLPTEAEWEYAARAGTQSRYWWGDDIGRDNAVCVGCGSRWDNQKTAPAGSFKANAFGLNDTAGNVWELTQDCWHENFTGASADGSAWLVEDGGDCSSRVVRGGSWPNAPRNLRSADRNSVNVDGVGGNLGFRIARDF